MKGVLKMMVENGIEICNAREKDLPSSPESVHGMGKDRTYSDPEMGLVDLSIDFNGPPCPELANRDKIRGMTIVIDKSVSFQEFWPKSPLQLLKCQPPVGA